LLREISAGRERIEDIDLRQADARVRDLLTPLDPP